MKKADVKSVLPTNLDIDERSVKGMNVYAAEQLYWHDLRGNENDLPKEDTIEVRVCYEVRDDNPMYGPPTKFLRYKNVNKSFTNETWEEIFKELNKYQGKCIAWMELPKFNK